MYLPFSFAKLKCDKLVNYVQLLLPRWKKIKFNLKKSHYFPKKIKDKVFLTNLNISTFYVATKDKTIWFIRLYIVIEVTYRKIFSWNEF